MGALLATSAPANGLFAGLPYALGISGGFASPFAAELHPPGRRGPRRRRVGQPLDHAPRGAHRAPTPSSPRSTSRRAPSAATDPPISPCSATPRPARAALADELERRGHHATGWRTAEMAREIAANALGRRPLRGRLDRRVDRPPHAVDRAGGPAARREGGGRRLRALPRLSGDVPVGPRRPRLGVPQRLSVRRARAGQRHRRGRSPGRTA